MHRSVVKPFSVPKLDAHSSEKFGALINLIEQALFWGVRIGTGKSFVLLIWDTRKDKLYGDQDGAISCCSCSLSSDWRSYKLRLRL